MPAPAAHWRFQNHSRETCWPRGSKLDNSPEPNAQRFGRFGNVHSVESQPRFSPRCGSKSASVKERVSSVPSPRYGGTGKVLLRPKENAPIAFGKYKIPAPRVVAKPVVYEYESDDEDEVDYGYSSCDEDGLGCVSESVAADPRWYPKYAPLSHSSSNEVREPATRYIDPALNARIMNGKHRIPAPPTNSRGQFIYVHEDSEYEIDDDEEDSGSISLDEDDYCLSEIEALERNPAFASRPAKRAERVSWTESELEEAIRTLRTSGRGSAYFDLFKAKAADGCFHLAPAELPRREPEKADEPVVVDVAVSPKAQIVEEVPSASVEPEPVLVTSQPEEICEVVTASCVPEEESSGEQIVNRSCAVVLLNYAEAIAAVAEKEEMPSEVFSTLSLGVDPQYDKLRRELSTSLDHEPFLTRLDEGQRLAMREAQRVLSKPIFHGPSFAFMLEWYCEVRGAAVSCAASVQIRDRGIRLCEPG